MLPKQSATPRNLDTHMPDYDPLRADAYAEHLAEVNQSKQVVAAADIFNSQGILLVKKGQQLSAEAVERIVQFKLARPLEDCIDITDSLTAEKLLVLFKESLRDEDSKVLYATIVGEEVAEFCQTFFQYPLLVQKLTVLWMQIPQEFHKSISVTWASLVAAQRLRLTKNERLELFIAALVHDIGMLHIPREIITTTGSLTQEQWRAVKSHPVIGQKILQQVENLSPAVTRAVLEHHEMADGTGYPIGKFGSELSVSSQLISMLDSAFAILLNKLVPKNLGTRFIAPILQINSSSYRPDVFNIVVAGLHEFKHKTVPMVPREQCRTFVDGLAAEAEILNVYRTAVSSIADMMVSSARSKNRLLQAAQTLSQQLEILVRTSGILDKNYFVSLMQELENSAPESESDMEEAYLMLQELRWQFSKLARICLSITENENLLRTEQREMFLQALGNLPTLSTQ